MGVQLHPFRTAVEAAANPDGRDHAFVFETTVAGKRITGCDFLHFDDDGRIETFMVTNRPLPGAMALAEALGAQFEQIKAEAGRA